MNIVVVGDGKVGYTLTASLSKEGHDVTVIDNRPDTLRNTTNELDVICIEGNGVSYAVQSEAGVQKADLLIAATSADEINMLACMVAKKLGAKIVVPLGGVLAGLLFRKVPARLLHLILGGVILAGGVRLLVC